MSAYTEAVLRYGRRGGGWVTETRRGEILTVPAQCGCESRSAASLDMIGIRCGTCGREILSADQGFQGALF